MSVLCINITQSCNEHRFHMTVKPHGVNVEGTGLFYFGISEYSSYLGYIKLSVTTNEQNCTVPPLSTTILLSDLII